MNNHTINELSEPSVGHALSYGFEKMKDNFLIFFLVVLVFLILDSLGEGKAAFEHDGDFNIIRAAYTLLFVPVIKYGADLIFLRGVRGDKVEVKDLAAGFSNYINVVLAALIVFGLVGIAAILFIIPGIYVACRLAFVSYLVMDEGLDPVASVEASWRLTRGHTWTIFLLGLVSILIFMLGLVCLIVGVFPAVMWAKSAFAAMYLSVTQQGSTEKQEGSEA